MTSCIIHDQTKMHGRTHGATSLGGGCDRASTPAHGEQGLQSGFFPLFDDLPVNWRGRRAPSLSIRFARAALPGAAHRRLVRCPPIGRAATLKFSRRLTESRAHQLRISRKPGSDRAYPLHLEHPSSALVSMPNHRISGVANVGIEVVGERNV